VPIRTNRGRAAVYRRLWGWPLRSPRHLAASIIIFVVVVVSLGVIIPKVLDRKPADPAAGGQPSTSSQGTQVGQLPSSGVSLPTKQPPPTNNASAAPTSAEAQVRAELWAEAWVRPPPDNDVNKWLAELRPYTTEEFLAQMATIDPKNVPDRLTPGVRPVRSTVSSADFEVSTDLGKVVITLIRVPSDKLWLVNGYKKAD
jgi:hypothetical protein